MSLSFVILVTKLGLSLLFYLVLFLLEKIFANKFFLVTNSLLTLIVLFFLVFLLKTKPFIPPESPQLLSLADSQTLKLTKDQANQLLTQQQTFNEVNLVSQKYYLNLANLNSLAGDKQKADYFLQIARYINPNSDLVE